MGSPALPRAGVLAALAVLGVLGVHRLGVAAEMTPTMHPRGDLGVRARVADARGPQIAPVRGGALPIGPLLQSSSLLVKRKPAVVPECALPPCKLSSPYKQRRSGSPDARREGRAVGSEAAFGPPPPPPAAAEPRLLGRPPGDARADTSTLISLLQGGAARAPPVAAPRPSASERSGAQVSKETEVLRRTVQDMRRTLEQQGLALQKFKHTMQQTVRLKEEEAMREKSTHSKLVADAEAHRAEADKLRTNLQRNIEALGSVASQLRTVTVERDRVKRSSKEMLRGCEEMARVGLAGWVACEIALGVRDGEVARHRSFRAAMLEHASYESQLRSRLERSALRSKAAAYVSLSAFVCIALLREWGVGLGQIEMGRVDEEVSELRREVWHRRRRVEELHDEVQQLQAQVCHAEEQARTLKHTAAHAARGQQTVTAANTLLLAEQKGLLAERRRLQTLVQELRGNIRVICRLRPLPCPSTRAPEKDSSSSEGGGIAGGGGGVGSYHDGGILRGTVRLTGPAKPYGFGVELTAPPYAGALSVAALQGKGGSMDRGVWNFVFDSVLDQGATQQDVFDEVSSMVESVLDGYRACIFAYGQTGSGKTHTMEGPPWSLCPSSSAAVATAQHPDALQDEGDKQGTHSTGRVLSDDRGIIPRSVELLFDECRAREASGWEYTIQVSYLEIYNEQFRDLLDHRFAFNKQMEIKGDGKNGMPYVTNLITMNVLDADVVYSLLARANKVRSTAATENNLRSSRSHAVFTLKVSGWNPDTQHESEGSLTLVDLAGAERLSTVQGPSSSSFFSHEEQQQYQQQKQQQHERTKETQNINKSLSCLGDVIMALTNKERHVPFRNSKLTHLLQPYLSGGNSKTLMLVNVNPADDNFQETLRAARFATRVSACDIGVARRSSRLA
jgi:kinesin family member C1